MQILAMHGVLGFSNETWIETGHVTQHIDATLRSIHHKPNAAVDEHGQARRAEALQALAQQLLLLDRTEDAADYFERCVKEAPVHSRPDQRARSCLIAGLQALHRNQLRTGWNCLQRVLAAKGASLSVSVQACSALAALYFQLGMRRPAAAAVERGLALLGSEANGHRMPRAILQALRVEFVVLDLLRQHEGLADLAFWPRHEEVAGSRIGVAQARALLDTCRRHVAGFAFLNARLDFLEALIRIAFEPLSSEAAAMAHVQQLNDRGLLVHAHAARHELALACIGGRKADSLAQLMNVYAGAGRARCSPPNKLEHDYCLAKLGELTGRDDAYITHYRAYAVESLVHMRQTCAYITVPSTMRQPGADVLKDDVASRLTGKYRRAYQFILANLQRNDLSIRDVADEIGVTERALQLAFGSALGLSPSAVIRQCRMDRIRDELSSAASSETTMLDVARRWGLRSRSALSQAYKTSFGELPSETRSLLVG
jgi:AraC-like DNA-binding protein